ncbi:Beta-1,2-xylosyltransferase 1 [Colletotrichum spinosum]|uniref:Beta-1,2-xylosyltransferase 1 n=1 Tax=Colletotrichum spinosum TaxID=1347390 RepID=A0A4R8PZB5_9PEZI|nr:Beta-1,2-xylosyltransferase 1 [Colletotrichum spinosum]
MSRDAHLHLTALCALVSFLWISYNFERHSLVEWPRLSSVLIFLVSGGFTWLASCLAPWLPGAEGRFDESTSVLKGDFEPSVPARPRRYYVPLLIACIGLRLEVFHRVTAQLQCSMPGVQSFLCALLVFYDVFYCRRPTAPALKPIEPWDTPLDDLTRWLSGAHTTMFASTFLMSCGTFFAVDQEPRSTYFCSALLDKWMSTLGLQLLGLFLDAAIAVLLHRILSWTKTTKSRLRTLGVIQAITGVFIKIFQLLVSPLIASGEGYPGSWGAVDSLYLFDVLIDSFTFTVLISSLSILICETSPSLPANIITFVSGMSAAYHNVVRIGSWQIHSKPAAIIPLYITSASFVLYLYASNTRVVVFLHRMALVVMLPLFIAGLTLYGLIKSDTVKDHPLEQMIYENRIAADRWLREASTSDSLHIAVEVYQERHYGRDPPPNFDKWYQFAKDRKSVIIDHFEQMESDILPFWGVRPETIRQGCERAATEPRMAVITIENHKAVHNYQWDDDHRKVLDETINMIHNFVEHLSDMKIPINLAEHPRVLTPWSDLSRYMRTGKSKKFKLLSARSEEMGDAPAPPPVIEEAKGPQAPEEQPPVKEENFIPMGVADAPTSLQAYASTKAFRELESSICWVGSPSRSGLHWNVRDFCSSCVKLHSDKQFIWSWAESKSFCDQQDLSRLHGFHLAPPQIAPIRDFVPVFGRSKVEGFNDILLPLVPLGGDQPPPTKDFRQNKDELYWRGKIEDRPVTDESLRGSHKHRLVHLVNNATAAEDVTMLVLAPGQKNWYGYEAVPAREANKLLPFNIGISDYECHGAACDVVRAELGQRPAASPEPLEHRYVFLIDSDTGPPPEILRTIRSASSVPFLTSIFGEWYSERLRPWLHFVPVDLRYQALHSTLAYFVGLKDRGLVNGRKVETESRWQDGEWIATQGKKWAERALRREDMEIYLFRLLLEWGRVVRDDRDTIGFRLGKS